MNVRGAAPHKDGPSPAHASWCYTGTALSQSSASRVQAALLGSPAVVISDKLCDFGMCLPNVPAAGRVLP